MMPDVSIIRLVTRSFWFLFGSIWLLVGVPFLIIGLVVGAQGWRLASEGRTVEGIVLTKEIHRASSSRSTSTSYEVRYRFLSSNGQQREGRDEISVDAWEALDERGPVMIEYLPDDPGMNRVRGNNDLLFPLIFGGLGLLFTVGGGLAASVGVRFALRRQRLLQERLRV